MNGNRFRRWVQYKRKKTDKPILVGSLEILVKQDFHWEYDFQIEAGSMGGTYFIFNNIHIFSWLHLIRFALKPNLILFRQFRLSDVTLIWSRSIFSSTSFDFRWIINGKTGGREREIKLNEFGSSSTMRALLLWLFYFIGEVSCCTIYGLSRFTFDIIWVKETQRRRFKSHS